MYSKSHFAEQETMKSNWYGLRVVTRMLICIIYL